VSETINFLDGIIEERLSQLHTVMPCRVERFNESQGTADVVPLFMRKFKNMSAQVMPKQSGLPILKRKIKNGDIVTIESPYYERGDIVLVVFAERALDRVSTGKIADPQFDRKHGLDDGIIIGYLGWGQ
jgi:hypothetical protein